jgi:hypothetical protein
LRRDFRENRVAGRASFFLGGRLVLINSVLSSLSMFMMSFKIPKGVLEKLDYYRSRFFWQCDEH